MKRLLVIVLAVVLGTPGCASATRMQRVGTPQQTADRSRELMADYVSQLTIGSRVRVDLADGQRIRGRLMKAGPQGLVIQKNTRIPEPPLEIGLDRVVAVELDDRSNVGKTVAIAAAVSVAAVFSVFAVLAAVYDD